MRRAFQIVSGTLLGLLVVVGVWLASGSGPESPGWNGETIAEGVMAFPAPYAAPPLELTGSDGGPVTLAGLDGEVRVVFFGFTHCPDVCPLTLATVGRALELMDEDPVHVRALFVTVDPERDTPERLAEYLDGFDEVWQGATGTQEDVEAVLAAWGVVALRDEVEGSGDAGAHSAGAHAGATINHTARTFVLDARNQVRLTVRAYASAESIAAALDYVLSEAG